MSGAGTGVSASFWSLIEEENGALPAPSMDNAMPRSGFRRFREARLSLAPADVPGSRRKLAPEHDEAAASVAANLLGGRARGLTASSEVEGAAPALSGPSATTRHDRPSIARRMACASAFPLLAARSAQ